MSIAAIHAEVEAKIEVVRSALAATLDGSRSACLTCSFQAEDVLLTRLAIAIAPSLPILFLDTGYHFAATLEYRDKIAAAWNLNLVNLIPAQTVAAQEAEHGQLFRTAPDQCCKLRKVEPLFRAVAGYDLWLTGLRREQARSRTVLEESAPFALPGGKTVLKLAPLANWTTREVWYACESLGIERLPLYELGYTSIGCEPCTTLPLDPNDPRSGRWAGQKVECGIHIQAASSSSSVQGG